VCIKRQRLPGEHEARDQSPLLKKRKEKISKEQQWSRTVGRQERNASADTVTVATMNVLPNGGAAGSAQPCCGHIRTQRHSAEVGAAPRADVPHG
jgi:hypothetical protein